MIELSIVVRAWEKNNVKVVIMHKESVPIWCTSSRLMIVHIPYKIKPSQPHAKREPLKPQTFEVSQQYHQVMVH